MAPNEETDLSKVTQCLIHTECSVVLIGSQGLRKLNQDQRPQVEGLRWQTPWWISQCKSVSGVFLGYQSLSNPPPLLYMFQFQIWVNYWVLRQSTCWSTWKHHDYTHEEKGLWQIQISVWKVLKTLFTSDSNYKFGDLPRPFLGSIIISYSKSSLKAVIHMVMVIPDRWLIFNSFFIFSAI